MISTKGLFLVLLTFVNNFLSCCSCKYYELNRTELSNKFLKLFFLFSEELFIWYKAFMWEGYLLVCLFWDCCSLLRSWSLQHCTSELVNHLLPWINSTVISSRCQLMFKWMDQVRTPWCMYLWSINRRSLHYLRYNCWKAHPPLASTSWQIKKWAITAQSIGNQCDI